MLGGKEGKGKQNDRGRNLTSNEMRKVMACCTEKSHELKKELNKFLFGT